MKVFAVLSVARQIDGEYIAIKIEGAFQEVEKANALFSKLKSDFFNIDGTRKVVVLNTPYGNIECHCEIDTQDFEVI